MVPSSELSTDRLGIVLSDGRPDKGRQPGKPPQDEFPQQGTRECILGEKPPQSGMINTAYVGSHGLVIAQRINPATKRIMLE